jgi:hypothetical protein
MRFPGIGVIIEAQSSVAKTEAALPNRPISMDLKKWPDLQQTSGATNCSVSGQ